MKKFRENATILHNAAAKRKIAANLVKKESSTQLRIFNTLFTAQNSVENDEEEEENETIQKKREKEKKLESVIQARIEQREREEAAADISIKEEEEGNGNNNQKNKTDKAEKDLFGKLKN
uniref:Uncharacterized protein n=1 Tax=Panagrolaimus sp. PS1159 TaxID=55785 RepID=A0AC35H0F1_9BILA